MKPLSFKLIYNNDNFFSIILVSKGIIPTEINSKVYRLPIPNLTNTKEKAVFLLEYPFSDCSFDSTKDNFDYLDSQSNNLSSYNNDLLPFENLDSEILKEIYSDDNINDLLNFDDYDSFEENCLINLDDSDSEQDNLIDFDDYHSFNIYQSTYLNNYNDILNNFNTNTNNIEKINQTENTNFNFQSSCFSELDPIDYNDSISILCNLIIEYLNRDFSLTNKERTSVFNNLYEIIDKSIYDTILNF